MLTALLIVNLAAIAALALRMENRMATLKEDIAAGTAAIEALGTALTTLAADQAQAFADLKAKIDAGGATADDLAALEAGTQKLSDFAAEVTSLDADAKAADA